MINFYLSKVMIEDDPCETENERLIEIIDRSQKIQNRQLVVKLVNHSDLNQADYCEKVNGAGRFHRINFC